MSNENLVGKISMPCANVEFIKACQELMNFKVINLNEADEETKAHLFRDQTWLLNDLKQKGFTSEKVREISSQDNNFYIQLYNFGINFESFKEAGIAPSSLLGLDVMSHYNGYLHTNSWESTINVHSLLDLGYTVKELLEDGIEDKEIPPEHLVDVGYSLDQLKNLGHGFNTNKKLFPLEEILKSYDLKTMCRGGIPIENFANQYSYSVLYNAGYSPRALQKAGANAKTMKELGIPAKKLRRGFRFYDYDNERIVSGAFFSEVELKEAGYEPFELKEAGISAKKMKEIGFSKKDLEGVFTNKYLNRLYNN